jgi:hypothetical protein
MANETYYRKRAEGFKSVQLMISPEMYRKFKIMAAADEVTTSEMMAILVENHWHDYFVKDTANAGL